jgi:hypothetical protein
VANCSCALAVEARIRARKHTAATRRIDLLKSGDALEIKVTAYSFDGDSTDLILSYPDKVGKPNLMVSPATAIGHGPLPAVVHRKFYCIDRQRGYTFKTKTKGRRRVERQVAPVRDRNRFGLKGRYPWKPQQERIWL